jgi:alanyl-tRNA synthetase
VVKASKARSTVKALKRQPACDGRSRNIASKRRLPRSGGKSGEIRTELLFWADPYATRSDARVTAVEGNEVELDRTVFFVFSGGQESDHGTIAGLAVQEATLDGHRIQTPHPVYAP